MSPAASRSGSNRKPGSDAIASKGWLKAHRWLLLRRFSQLGLLLLFLLGPWFGIWIVKGNLNSSLTLDWLPLTDPLVFLQSLLAGHAPELAAVTGALIVVAFYWLVGGRAYCAWVCPLNLVTDGAHWLRQRLGLSGGAGLNRSIRYWLLGIALLVSLLSGTIAWEFVNPVSMLHRGLVFGMGAAWAVVAAVFLFDLLVSRRGWCGHLCPVGAFYGAVGSVSVIRVGAFDRARCNDCSDCMRVCPEPHVIKLPLYGADQGAGPVIASPDCNNCGRCIDVCSQEVFRFGTRFGGASRPRSLIPEETQP